MLKEIIASHLAAFVPLPEEELLRTLEYPADPGHGDVAFPCFSLAKTMRQSPNRIAEELARSASTGLIAAEAAGPYLNFSFNRPLACGMMLDTVRDGSFGTQPFGRGKRAVVDFSSPNIAKPFGIGHLRSTMLGNAIANLLAACGFEVVRVNHIGDWGTQFGKMIEAYLRWGDPQRIAEIGPIKAYLELYVRFHEEAEADPALEEEARAWFQKLESGDPEARSLWQTFVDQSMEEFGKLYDRLGVRFEHVLGESFYNDKMDATVSELAALGLLEDSDGAKVVRLDEHGLPPCIIVKSDGASIYATRDLATAVYRRGVMGADELLYVVGAEQSLHFRQLFLVLEKMDPGFAGKCKHVPFGLMRIEGRKMSTRKGKVVFLEDVLNEAAEHALRKIEEKNPALPNKAETAEAIGIGAVIFADLKNARMLEVDFSLEEIVNFDGDTGPYLQYAYARTRSLLSKGKAAAGDAMRAAGGGAALASSGEDAQAASSGAALASSGEAARAAGHLAGDSAWELLKLLSLYPEHVKLAAEKLEPSIVAKYLLEVARRFNRFYHHERILAEDADERGAKLALAGAAGDCLRNGLTLLGIKTPEQI